MRSDLPGGTVTFLFTDIEGSTRLLHDLGPEGYAAALNEHRRVLRGAFRSTGGVEVDTQGDAFFVAFATAQGALDAARGGLEALEAGPVRVRMGLHTGTPLVTDEGYVGVDVHRAARIAACGHGGQVLVSAATAELVDRGLLVDLGAHRLKDLSAPERIYQLGDSEFARLKTLHQINLPVPATPFMGRARELALLGVLLAAEHPRLITLTGPGGTGKTRLALQAAADAADHYPDGVFWVPLAPVRDASTVLATVAQAMGTSDEIFVHLGNQAVLLVLDNVEQVVGAAPDIAALLTSCPRVTVMVTSRELLAVAGEQAFPVPTFDTAEGVAFFTTRARSADPAFAATAGVGDLCDRLDQLPLALELAAARVRVMSVDKILDRITGRLDLFKGGRGTDPRQQTLRAMIEWSHDLLNASEQELFARLAVFVGGCTLEAAEDVCDADLDVLQSLVDKSLLGLRDDNRFWMLETIHGFALERLASTEWADNLRDRHAQYFLGMSRGADFAMEALEVAAHGFAEIQAEHPNLLAALDHLEQSGESQRALEMTAALSPFWLVAGFFAQARNRLESALCADPAATPARGAALNWLAETLLSTSSPGKARERSEESLVLYRSLKNARGIAESLHILAYCQVEEGDLEGARDLLEQCQPLLEADPPDRLAIWVGRSLAWVHLELGDLDAARTRYEVALAEAQRQGNRAAEATILGALGLVAGKEGRTTDALRLSHASMRVWAQLHDPLSIGQRLIGVALILAMADWLDDAARALAHGRVILAEIGAEEAWVTRLDAQTEAVLTEHLPDLDRAQLQLDVAGVSADEAIVWVLSVLSRPDLTDESCGWLQS